MTPLPPDILTPEQIITRTLRLILASPGPIHPELAAKQVLANLAGHRYELLHKPAAPAPCRQHPSIKLTGLGHCPICGPP